MLKLLKEQCIKNNLFLKVMVKKDSKLVAFCAVVHCRHQDKLSSLKNKNVSKFLPSSVLHVVTKQRKWNPKEV